MTALRQQPASLSSANLGFVSCACGLAGVIFPPLILVSLPTAHCAWWKWLSGREERGFGWAMAAMLLAHIVFALWVILLAGNFAGPQGVKLSVMYLVVFIAAVGLVLRSAAAKYIAFGTLMATFALTLVTCYTHQQREAARTNQCVNNLRQIGVAFVDFNRNGELNGYNWNTQLFPYVNEMPLAEEDATRDPFEE